METKRNLKYFTSKGINPVLVAGLIIVALGLILMIVPQTRPFGLVIALVGIGVAVFATGAKSGEEEIDNQIEGEPQYDGYYPLELRFKRDHSLMDGKGQTVSNLVCFYIGSYNIDRLGCNGYEIKFTGLDSETNKDPEGKPMKSIKIMRSADMK